MRLMLPVTKTSARLDVLHPLYPSVSPLLCCFQAEEASAKLSGETGMSRSSLLPLCSLSLNSTYAQISYIKLAL